MSKKKYYDFGDRTPKGRLPKNVKYETTVQQWDENESDEAADILSDEYGFCVESFNIAREDHGNGSLTVFFNDIVWDTTE